MDGTIYNAGLSLSLVGASHRTSAAVTVDHVEAMSTFALTCQGIHGPALTTVHAFAIFVAEAFLADAFPLGDRVDLVHLAFRNADSQVSTVDLALGTSGADSTDEVEAGFALAGKALRVEPLVGQTVSETSCLTVGKCVLELTLRAGNAAAVD